MAAVIETSLGDITVDLFTEKRPKTCFNFLKLCKCKYYNFCMITEIKKDYTVRTGDPLGNGGESIYVHAHGELGRLFEAETEPRIKHTSKGCISMINNGSGKHGSQFFITLEEDLDYLDKQGHTVFGVVSEGLEILSLINDQIVDLDGVPFQDICISHTVILEDPFDDPPYLEKLFANISSPTIPDRLLDSDRIGIYEGFNDDEGKDKEQLKEEMEQKEAQARAILLEMIGDLPDAEVKPPENVLFICKLNPITEGEDLKRIFRRFGPISSCEIIKDPKTDQSLQYGFIEFENREDCERAYLKMDNVLIDDRRIHVDFSQSVAKQKWQQYRQMRKAQVASINSHKKQDRNDSKHTDRHDRHQGSRDSSNAKNLHLSFRASRDSRDPHRDPHDFRDSRNRDARDPHRDPHDSRDSRDLRDPHRGSRSQHRDSRDFRNSRNGDSRDLRDTHRDHRRHRDPHPNPHRDHHQDHQEHHRDRHSSSRSSSRHKHHSDRRR